jgi:hypothetical protein
MYLTKKRNSQTRFEFILLFHGFEASVPISSSRFRRLFTHHRLQQNKSGIEKINVNENEREFSAKLKKTREESGFDAWLFNSGYLYPAHYLPILNLSTS